MNEITETIQIILDRPRKNDENEDENKFQIKIVQYYNNFRGTDKKFVTKIPSKSEDPVFFQKLVDAGLNHPKLKVPQEQWSVFRGFMQYEINIMKQCFECYDNINKSYVKDLQSEIDKEIIECGKSRTAEEFLERSIIRNQKQDSLNEYLESKGHESEIAEWENYSKLLIFYKEDVVKKFGDLTCPNCNEQLGKVQMDEGYSLFGCNKCKKFFTHQDLDELKLRKNLGKCPCREKCDIYKEYSGFDTFACGDDEEDNGFFTECPIFKLISENEKLKGVKKNGV